MSGACDCCVHDSHVKAAPGTVSWTQCHSQGFVRTDGGVEAKGRGCWWMQLPLELRNLGLCRKGVAECGL